MFTALFMQSSEAWTEYRVTELPNTNLQPRNSYNLNSPFEGNANLPKLPGKLDSVGRRKLSTPFFRHW